MHQRTCQRGVLAAIAAFGLLCAASIAAAVSYEGGDGTGNSAWCRQEGGRTVDVIRLTSSGPGFKASFHEGEGAPAYAEGFGMLKGMSLTLAVFNPKAKVMTYVDASMEGAVMNYRSYNLDGSLRWQGSFNHCR